MTVALKKLEDQTIVITGASSGIGLATARMAGQRRARLVLAARSEGALRQLTAEINGSGGRAVCVVADVANEEDVRRIAQTAQEAYGGFDTWINNAGTSIYGKIEEVPVADMRKLFDTNYWGIVYGSLEAVKHLKGRGGALINLGSTVSDRAVPLQGTYSASKHAIKGFTDALRMELEADGAPISVTLIKPGPIDTPFPTNAKNYLETEPQHIPRVYTPEIVAHAILHAAETPTRDVFVGSSGKQMAMLGYRAPRLADKFMERFAIPGTKSGKPPRPRAENALDRPSEHLTERGDYPGHVAKSSLYTAAALRPGMTRATLATAGLAGAAWWGVSRNGGLKATAKALGSPPEPARGRKKPISRKAHGAIDYGFLGMMLTAPSLLGLTGPAKALPYLFGGIQGGLNAVTDQPLAVKRAVPFRTHGWVELASGPAFVALPVVTGALKQPKARAFFGAALAMLVTVYSLTNWDARTDK